MTAPVVAGLVLAAGESRRMGRPKALLPFRDHTFLDAILQCLRAAGISRTVVVLGHSADEIQLTANLGAAEVVVNAQYRLGQTSSLQAGLRAIHDAEGALLGLVDHPSIRPETIRRLVRAFEETKAPVVVPAYQGRRGHPVVIARALFPELLALNPDQGANAVVRKYRDASVEVSVDDPGIVQDVDTPDDYTLLAGGNSGRIGSLSGYVVKKP